MDTATLTTASITTKQIEAWNALPVSTLVHLAETGAPDDYTASEGALFLREVRGNLADAREDYNDVDLGEVISYIADGAVSIWTSEMWRQFADLGLGDEDPADFCYTGGTVNDACKAVLYGVAERLCYALLECEL